jgi:hypothetical protein
MVRRGVNPAEAYRYAKAEQDLAAEKTAEKTAGPLGMAAEVAGGLATGAGVFGGARAATIPFTSRALPQAAVGPYNYARNVLKGGAIGAAAGSGEGNTFDERFGGAQMGGVIGGGISAALPVIGSAASTTGRILQTPRLRDPQNIATEQVAKVYRDSGENLTDVVQRMANARAAGQPDYMLADALGKEGTRKLAAQAKTPGEARDTISDYLAKRNKNLPINTGDEVGRAMGAPMSAAAATESLIDKASREAAPLYRKAESVPTWSNKLQEFLDNDLAKQGLAAGRKIQDIRAAGTGRPANATDAVITDFNPAVDASISGVPNMKVINQLKVGLDRMIESEVNPATGRVNAMGSAIRDYKNRLLAEVDAINPAYKEARNIYRGSMEVKDAVEFGRDMATRGRHVDTVPEFKAMSHAEQQGARIGYADKIREGLEKNRYPTALQGDVPKGVHELDALSLYQGPRQPGRPDQLRQYLNRNEEMRATSKAAIGGSSTAENLADITSAPGGAELVGAIGSAAHGNPFGVARNAYELFLRGAKGESEAQRSAIAKMLMAREPADVQEAAKRIAEHNLRRRGYNPWTGSVRLPEGQ